MKDVEEIISELIDAHESASFAHRLAVQAHEATSGQQDESRFNLTKINALYAGTTVSATGSQLRGFIVGLLVAATARQQHDD